VAVSMELRKVSDDGCEGGECPTVYLSDRGTVVFQGDAVTRGKGGEQAVESPLDVVRSAWPELFGGR
jgi:hypothetical protein